MSLHAITVLGHDRPGIIAEATGAVSNLGLNLEDSTMTLLRGHFAMMLVCSGPAPAGAIEEALATLTEDGTLSVSVREVPDELPGPLDSSHPTAWVLSVHGGDRPGIVSAVVQEVARVGGNITDLTTRLAGELYVLIAEIDMPAGVDIDSLQRSLEEVAASLGVGATLRAAETDEL